MDNFFYGLQALSIGLLEMLRRLFAYQLFWGFISGFLVSTIIHGYLMTENPKAFASMVFEDKAKSFQKTYDAAKTNNRYTVSFADYAKKAVRLKLSFLIIISLFIIGIFFALFSY